MAGTNGKSVEFFYDIVCPFAYVASCHIAEIAKRTNAKLVLKPVLLGGMSGIEGIGAAPKPKTAFKKTKMFELSLNTMAAKGSAADNMNETKKKHLKYDLVRFIELRQVKLVYPSHHPCRSLLALRVLLYLSSENSSYQPKQDMWKLTQALFSLYWTKGVDISDPAALASSLSELGIENASQVVTDANENVEVQEDLKTRTQDAVDRGLFGVPSFFVTVDGKLNKHFIYGQDNLELVEKLLGGQTSFSRFENALKAPATGAIHPVDFYFDFSSPFAYFATLHVEKLFGAGNINMKPVLLGAVFKGVGTNNQPMSVLNDAQRKYATREMKRIASTANIPFVWVSRFPLRTILCLRLAIAAGVDTPKGRKLIKDFYLAFWGHDADPNDTQVLTKLITDCGLDAPQLFEKANTPEIKEALIQNTNNAITDGVFGVPTIAVKKPGKTEWYWGFDRMLFALQDAHSKQTQSKM